MIANPRINRIYQNVNLSINAEINLDARASHHLGTVLRANIGSEVIVFNGQGGEYRATIVAATKKTIRIFINAYQEVYSESPTNITLVPAVIRNDKMDIVIQKAVELGVNKIVPLSTARSQNYKLDQNKRLQHWQQIIISACEQSGRAILPGITTPITMSAYLNQSHKADKSYILHPPSLPGSKVRSKELGEKHPTAITIVLMVGPEGGFTEQEIFQAQAKDFKLLSLGPRILRAETASIVGLAYLQANFGDFLNR